MIMSEPQDHGPMTLWSSTTPERFAIGCQLAISL